MFGAPFSIITINQVSAMFNVMNAEIILSRFRGDTFRCKFVNYPLGVVTKNMPVSVDFGYAPGQTWRAFNGYISEFSDKGRTLDIFCKDATMPLELPVTLSAIKYAPLDILNDLLKERCNKSDHSKETYTQQPNLYRVRAVFRISGTLMVVTFLAGIVLLALFAGLNLPSSYR